MTAQFTKFEDTAQAADIKASRGPNDVFRGYMRRKEYAKADDIAEAYLSGHGLRSLEFDQPFQWAQSVAGGTWNDHRAPLMVQFAKCNLACAYCFADTSAENTAKKSFRELLADADEFYGDAPGILRISGGEPWLERDFLRDIMESEYRTRPLWVDTNLTVKPDFSEPNEREGYPAAPPVAICGCFKPGMVPFEDSIDVLDEFIVWGFRQLFLYYPADLQLTTEDDFAGLLKDLHDFSPGLVLRLTVLLLNWDYAQTGRNSGAKVGWQKSLAFYQRLRRVRDEFLREHYSPEELWLPSHQVSVQ